MIPDFLDKETKSKLKNALNLINKKYDKRKDYYDKINEAKECITTKDLIEGNQNKRNGLCIKDDLIYCETIPIKGNVAKNVQMSFSEIIVGWKINSNIKDGNNGNYKFYDPILTKTIDFNFEPKSKKLFGKNEQNYDLEIYLMKFPE